MNFLLFQRKRLLSSFVTPKVTKYERDILEERNQIYWNICFFGNKIINTSSIESLNQSNSRAKDDTRQKFVIPYNPKKTKKTKNKKKHDPIMKTYN